MAIRTLHSSIFIASDPMHVWEVLTDFRTLREWNPLIIAAEGELRPGESVKLTLAPRDGARFVCKAEVLDASPGRDLRWAGHLMTAGLLKGEHYFRISPSTTGVRFVQGCAFSGLFAALLPRAALSRVRRRFEAMNRALKARAELDA